MTTQAHTNLNSLRRLAPLLAVVVLAGCANNPLFESPPPIAPEQVVSMAKRGDSTANIISELQKSRTIYSLTASQFAQLSKDGVPDAVLDFMQQTHLKEIERQARRDAHFDAWWQYGWYGHPFYATPRVIYVRPRVKAP